MRSAGLFLGALALATAGCAVAVRPGEPVYDYPAAVEQPPDYSWGWVPWPHRVVEHNFVVEDEHVRITDHHYYPFYRDAHPYLRNDEGTHRGWFKRQDHDRDRDHDRD
jgi:hypothetical protein